MQCIENIVVVIPAYNPPKRLEDFTNNLFSLGIKHIIVVDDGSDKQYEKHFNNLGAIVLKHDKNQGKGRALKTAFTYCIQTFNNISGVVTADADGQHTVNDILKVAKQLDVQKKNLIIGAREFGKQVPFKSKLGNVLTRNVFRIITGQRIQDTQSGLRGIPFNVLPEMISLSGEQYEYETNMLLLAKTFGLHIREIPIKTVYIDNNRGSHFNPIWDSIKIYFLILRFMSSSLMTVMVDYVLFFVFYLLSKNLFISIFGARICASILNFNLNKRYVFKNNDFYYLQICKYYVLFFCMMGMAFFAISIFKNYIGCNIFFAKIISESLLFPINFKIQRDFVFR